jgi:DNA-binding MarR family transcriptional regulator
MKRNPKSRKSSLETVPPDCPVKIHPHLTTYIGYCLHKVALRLRANLDARAARFGMVSPQYGMLVILSLEGVMKQNELGSYMAMDKATMVRMLDGLEDLGYIRRRPSDEDRRAKLVELTADGRKVITALHKLREEAEKEFLSPLSTSERAQLRDLVLRLMR